MKLAEAYGIKGYTIEQDSDIERVLDEAYTRSEPCFIECKVHHDFPTLAHWRWK
jgi:thiamine pyrophosphate-dependent acetolactate synthase large subunit-like protein